jgi:hypothetical protein
MIVNKCIPFDYPDRPAETVCGSKSVRPTPVQVDLNGSSPSDATNTPHNSILRDSFHLINEMCSLSSIILKPLLLSSRMKQST